MEYQVLSQWFSNFSVNRITSEVCLKRILLDLDSVSLTWGPGILIPNFNMLIDRLPFEKHCFKLFSLAHEILGDLFQLIYLPVFPCVKITLAGLSP